MKIEHYGTWIWFDNKRIGHKLCEIPFQDATYIKITHHGLREATGHKVGDHLEVTFSSKRAKIQSAVWKMAPEDDVVRPIYEMLERVKP